MEVKALLFLVLSKIIVAEAQTITSRPRNTAALTGSLVTLDCVFTPQAGLVVSWREYTTSSTGDVIYDSQNGKNTGHTKADRYILNPNAGTGQYNLQITSLQTDDTGYYTCAGDAFGNKQYGAYLVSLGSKRCSAHQNGSVEDTVVEGQLLTLTCQRDYKSYPGWAPVLSWVGQTATPRNDTTADSVRYEIDLEAQDSMDKQTYTCATSFTNPPRFTTDSKFEDDTTAPIIDDVCNTTINVHWAAKNFIFLPNQTEYNVGQQITCHASANPQPVKYEWAKVSGYGPETVESHTLTTTAEMTNKTSVYHCNVTNLVKKISVTRSQSFSFNVSFFGEVQSEQSLSPGEIAGIVIGSTCLVVIIVLLAVIIKKKCF